MPYGRRVRHGVYGARPFSGWCRLLASHSPIGLHLSRAGGLLDSEDCRRGSAGRSHRGRAGSCLDLDLESHIQARPTHLCRDSRPTFELLRTGHADAFASIRPVLLAYSSRLPGSRVLEDHYGANLLGMVVPKGQTGRLAYIGEFIEQAKDSGLVQQAIERASLPGHRVAATKTN